MFDWKLYVHVLKGVAFHIGYICAFSIVTRNPSKSIDGFFIRNLTQDLVLKVS